MAKSGRYHRESPANQWYCQLQGVTSGPFTNEELKFLVLRGRLSRNDDVRKGTEGEWVKAGSLKGLFEPTAQAPNGGVSSVVRPRMSRAAEPGRQDEIVPSSGIPDSIRAKGISSGSSPPALPPQNIQPRDLALIGSGIGMMLIVLGLFLWFLFQSLDTTPVAGRGQSGEGRMPGAGVGDSGRDERTSGGGGTVGEDAKASQVAEDEDDALETPEPEQLEQDDLEKAPVSEDAAGEEDASTAQAPETSAETSPQEQPLEEPDPPPAPGMFAIQQLAESEAGEYLEAGELREMFSHRSAGNRGELVQREGGSPESEAAVNLGLEWLANHQDGSGKWSLDQFNRSKGCDGECQGVGVRSDTAGTALALLPFLGAGETHQHGKYKKVVQKGLDWLIEDQKTDGSFQSVGSGNMYAHGQAAIALGEALAMTQDKKLVGPAQGAINYIVKCQHSRGGWRYSPGMAGDTSVLGWQILALRSAQSAGLKVPRQTLAKAGEYLDSAQADKQGGLYGYTPGGSGTPSMSAEGLLCRMYLGWEHSQTGLAAGTDYLLTHLPAPNHIDIYYWYYGTQVMHHYGGDPWKTWNSTIREILIESQATEGHMAGSWMGTGAHDKGGRVYATALALCCLEVYYRHKPLYSE